MASVAVAAVQAGTTTALDVAAVQTGRSPLSQPRWWAWLAHRTSPVERRLSRRGAAALAFQDAHLSHRRVRQILRISLPSWQQFLALAPSLSRFLHLPVVLRLSPQKQLPSWLST